MRVITVITSLLLLQSCSIFPVFEGDFVKFQDKVADELNEHKDMIKGNANVIHEAHVNDDDSVPYITGQHLETVSKWADEKIEFEKPTQGMDFVTLVMSIVMGTGALGGFAGIKKISNLKSLVGKVATMNPEDGKKEAELNGVKA